MEFTMGIIIGFFGSLIFISVIEAVYTTGVNRGKRDAEAAILNKAGK